jgi:NADH dehydrogenase FAD-containing subunit
MLPNVASDMVVWLRMLILQRLQQAGIKILTSTTVVEFTSDGAVIERDGKRETIDFMDTIVLALGVESANDLSEILRDRISEVYVIGDAKNPGKVHDAIVSGAEIGMQI